MTFIRILLCGCSLVLAGNALALTAEQKKARRQEFTACTINSKTGWDRHNCVKEVIKKYDALIKAEHDALKKGP